MILCLFFFLLLFVPDSELALSMWVASPKLTWSWNWGRPHGFHLLLPEETKSSSFILDLWGAFLYIFCCHFIWKCEECFRNMNWRSLALYIIHPRTKNYAANGVMIETLQFMGCATWFGASGAAMCWCVYLKWIVAESSLGLHWLHHHSSLEYRQMIVFIYIAIAMHLSTLCCG